MNLEFVKLVLKRFVKGFISGGASSLLLFLAQGQGVSDWHTYTHSLAVAFLTGGFLGLEKALQDSQ